MRFEVLTVSTIWGSHDVKKVVAEYPSLDKAIADCTELARMEASEFLGFQVHTENKGSKSYDATFKVLHHPAGYLFLSIIEQ